MIIVFDLETTGLSGAYCDVIQFSYIQLNDNGRIVKADSMFFYHKGMHWDQEVCDNVHHIELDFLEQFEDKFEENLVKMYTILSKADVIGHNAIGFDCPFANQWLSRMGLPGLTFSSIRDTMKVFQPITHTARIKLIKLCEVCGLTPQMIQQTEKFAFGTVSASHNANYDTAATAMLTMRAMQKGYIQTEGSVQIQAQRDTTAHKVCDGFYVQSPYGYFKVDSAGVVSTGSPIPELTLPIVMRVVGITGLSAMNGESGLTADTAKGTCTLHMSGAHLDVMGLTMPFANFRTLVSNLVGNGGGQ